MNTRVDSFNTTGLARLEDFFIRYKKRFTRYYKKKANGKNVENFSQDFWSGIEEKYKKKLEQDIRKLRKRELYRKYVSLVAMIPFAVFMAIELEKVCNSLALLLL